MSMDLVYYRLCHNIVNYSWTYTHKTDLLFLPVMRTLSHEGWDNVTMMRQSISNHWQLDCLFNTLFAPTIKNISKVYITDPLWRESTWWPIDSLNKGPLMWKAFPCHDIIIPCHFPCRDAIIPCHNSTEHKSVTSWSHCFSICLQQTTKPCLQ